MFRTLILAAAISCAAGMALAQGEPGAGNPSAPHGEPYAPNGTVAPSAVPGGGAMGTQASTLSNPTTTSDDQDRGVKARRRHPNATSVGGVSDRPPRHHDQTPNATSPTATPTPP